MVGRSLKEEEVEGICSFSRKNKKTRKILDPLQKGQLTGSELVLEKKQRPPCLIQYYLVS